MEVEGNDKEKLFLGDRISSASSLYLYHALNLYVPMSVLENQEKKISSGDRNDNIEIAEYLRVLFDEENKDMRRYSSPEELAENLKLYMNFTQCDWVFNSGECTPFNYQISTYESLRRNEYMYKRDVLVHLQNMIFHAFPSNMENTLTRKAVVAFLKFHATGLLVCEFVSVTDPLFPTLQDVEDLFKDRFKNTDQPSRDECPKIVTSGAWLEWVKPILSDVILALEQTFNSPMSPNQFLWLSVLIDGLTKMFSERKSIFRPDEGNITIEKPTVNRLFDTLTNMFSWKKKPIAIRLFEDGKRRFAMNMNNVSNKNNAEVLFTSDVKNVLAMITAYPDQDFELVKVPIKRAKHSAVPIPLSGGLFCKLAIDYFFEVLQDLIFGFKIFQKWNSDDIPAIDNFFLKYSHIFRLDEETIYFITEKNNRKLFLDHPKLDSPCPHIRDVGSNGFTAQDLKDELVYLGIKNMFPEVKSYAEDVYDHIIYEKEIGKVLKTSDMFDAIEHCIHIALFKALPQLAKFVHNQNGCHRLAVKDCCPLARPKPRFKETMWRTVKFVDVEIKKLNTEKDFEMSCPNGLTVCTKGVATSIILEHMGNSDKSIEFFETILGSGPTPYRRFMVDNVDIQKVTDIFNPNSELGSEQMLEMACKIGGSLHNFVKCIKNKRLYLRTFSFESTCRETMKWMFRDEAMEMIPILLEQQGDIVTEKIRKECERKETLDMIRLDDLRELLEKYDVNKGLLTLVPDPEHAVIIYQLPLAPCLPALPVYGPKGQVIFPKSEAIFQIFQQVICEIAWNSSLFDKNKFDFQNQIWKSLMECHVTFEYFVPGEWIDETISTLKANKHYVQRKKKKMLTPFIELHDADFADTISIANIIKLTSTDILNGKLPAGVKREDLEKLFVPVWKIRLLLYYHWWDTYLPSCASDDPVATNGLRLCIEWGLLDRIPAKPLNFFFNWLGEVVLSKSGEFVEYADALAIENSATFDLFPSHDWLSNSTWRDRPYINRCEKWTTCENFPSDMDEETLKRSVRDRYRRLLSSERKQWNKAIDVVHYMLLGGPNQEEKEERARSTEKKKGEGTASDTRKPAQIPPTDEPSTSKVSNAAPRTSNSRKPPAPSNQTVKKVSPPQTSEKQDTSQPSSSTSNSSNQPKESAVCAKCYRASVLCNEAKSALEGAKAEAKKWEKKFRAAEKELKAMKEREKGQKTREEMEKEMKKLKKAMEKLERREIAQARIREELEKANLNVREELREANATHAQESESWALEKSQWELEKEDNDSRMRHLKSVLQSDILANLDMRLSLDMRRILIDYQSKQDEVLSGVLVRNAEDLVHNLKRLAKDNHDTRQRADLEIRRFHRTHQIYQDAVISGIQKIQADVLITKSELDPLPDEPKLSDQLKELNQQLQVAENAALARQCIVCMVEDSSQPWYCCPICRNGLHLACVETWWNKSGQGTCPHCRYNTD